MLSNDSQIALLAKKGTLVEEQKVSQRSSPTNEGWRKSQSGGPTSVGSILYASSTQLVISLSGCLVWLLAGLKLE